MAVPKKHPRKVSLEVRHRLVGGFKRGLVAEAGLIAHGRGEAFDYLLGEKTTREAAAAEKAAVALLLAAEKPVVSVNGNVAALAAKDTVRLAKLLGAAIEGNLFYRTVRRERLIAAALRKVGADRVYGLSKRHRIPGLSSERSNVDDALWGADVVLVALEDGDRTEALTRMGKTVVAVDLNPLSRTARNADITIVDNIVRALPRMIAYAKVLRSREKARLKATIQSFDNKENLKASVERMRRSV